MAETQEQKSKSGEDVKNIFHWPPLESDPDIFTKYLRSVGMSPEWQIAEVYGLDPEMLAFVPKPCVGVIAAVDRKEAKKRGDGKPGNMETQASYFMKQTGSLDNACGVIAGIHSIFNNPAVAITPDSILAKFKENTAARSPAQRAKVLEGAKEFKEQHKAFAMQGQSSLAATQKQVTHHFISFVINESAQLIELDGTKDGPALIRENVSPETFLEAVAEEIKRRLNEGLISGQLSLLALTGV